MKEKLNLYKTDGNSFYYKEEVIKPIVENMEIFLESSPIVFQKEITEKIMINQEIKTNNQIEGYLDNLDYIKKVIGSSNKNAFSEKNKRIINLYNGYQFILNNTKINKDSLKNLYALLSEGLLTEKELSLMGDFYRKDKVFIYTTNNVFVDPVECMDHKLVDEYMNYYFDFLNNDNLTSLNTEIYLKSQILHFYFVYVHPYFDVNGRTARTASMWHLLNNDIYPYIIFNRAITWKKPEYYNVIKRSKSSNDLTHFLKYMLNNVKEELEKEIIIKKISDNLNVSLSTNEYQNLLYFLSIKGDISIIDFAYIYNKFNPKTKVKDIYQEFILPLLEKNIILIERETNKCFSGIPNKILKLNKKDIL